MTEPGLGDLVASLVALVAWLEEGGDSFTVFAEHAVRGPRLQMGNATGLFNLMRNLGGSVGISLATTLVARKAQAHQAMLVAHVTPYDAPASRS